MRWDAWRHSDLSITPGPAASVEVPFMQNFGFNFLYTTVLSSAKQVLKWLLKGADDGVMREFKKTRTGFVVGISIPDVPKSGGVYVYDRRANSVFMIEVGGRDCDLNRDELHKAVARVARHLNVATRPTNPPRHPSRRPCPTRLVVINAVATASTTQLALAA
jgi:hypothetical protein